jgi:hypothetical protein
MVKDVFGDGASAVRGSMASSGSTGGYFKDKIEGKS